MTIVSGKLIVQEFHIEVPRLDAYNVLVESGILNQVGAKLRAVCPESGQAFILTDDNVQALYAEPVLTSLTNAGFKSNMLSVVPSEPSKSLGTATILWEHLAAFGFRRRSVLVALGGGVITDLTGFVAATYMRGVPYINVPTTLVAQLDAAIGGKVGVDHERAKNLIGSFHHPCAVYADPEVLRTLPVREIANGLAEATKVAIIGSQPLFEFMEQHPAALLSDGATALAQVVRMAVETKITLLASDPYERDLRRALNFGHTIAHAIETVSAYQTISHGEAVAIGMATATRIARARKVCDEQVAERILKLLTSIGLPTTAPGIAPRQVWQALAIIRAIRDGSLHEVLPVDLGRYVFFEDLSEKDLERHLVEEAA